jgi:hypothetical protein
MELDEVAAAKVTAAERAAAAAAGPTRVVHLARPAAIEDLRRQLPILGLEQEIMEGITHHDVVVSSMKCGLEQGGLRRSSWRTQHLQKYPCNQTFLFCCASFLDVLM